MSLTSTANVKSWHNPNLDASRDTEIERCIASGDALVKRILGWDIEQVAVTLYLDGHDAYGDVLSIPAKYRPVIHSDPDFVTVSDSGSVLSVAASYDEDSGADVIVLGANKEQRCELYRRGGWIDEYANVTVTFKHGYGVGDIPGDIEQLATEVATLLLVQGAQVGKTSKTGKGGSLTFIKSLTPTSQELIRRTMEKVS